MRIREIPVNGPNLNVLLESVIPGVEAIQDVQGGIRVNGLMSWASSYHSPARDCTLEEPANSKLLIILWRATVDTFRTFLVSEASAGEWLEPSKAFDIKILDPQKEPVSRADTQRGYVSNSSRGASVRPNQR